jgi:hypothetical protein
LRCHQHAAGRASHYDEQAIRRAALQYNVPCVTTMTGAQAIVEAMRESGVVAGGRHRPRRRAASVGCGLARGDGPLLVERAHSKQQVGYEHANPGSGDYRQ